MNETASFNSLGTYIGILVEEIGRDEHESSADISDDAHEHNWDNLIPSFGANFFHQSKENAIINLLAFCFCALNKFLFICHQKMMLINLIIIDNIRV